MAAKFAFKLRNSVGATINGAGVTPVAAEYAAACAAEQFDRFVPCDTGRLAASAAIVPRMGRKAAVRYDVPYAAACYYGDGLNFGANVHPEASSRWDAAAMESGKGKLVRNVSDYIRGGGGKS
ncbi:hypothetical protein FACS1894219_12740 [Clostridia bacterium]|nr:hypothetical protein FACS1894219_12740 [Clostridia bacterium]